MSTIWRRSPRTNRFIVLLATALVPLAVACSNEKPADSEAGVDSGPNLLLDADLTGDSSPGLQADGIDDAALAELANDNGAPGELANSDAVANCPGGSGCPCKEHAECEAGLCIEDAAQLGGNACAQKCSSTCPTGYTCAAVNGGGDILTICVPKFAHLCEPCAASKDCEGLGLKDSTCVDQSGLGRFCGVSCSQVGDCPADYACADVVTAEGAKLKQCVRAGDENQQPFGVCPCSPAAVQKKLATACYVEGKDSAGKVTGQCMGSRSCTVGGLGACTANGAKNEQCNGQDDDCDGQTDESSCDDGKPCTQDSCDPAAGCQFKPLDGTLCDADGSVCTESDTCQAGACIAGMSKDCDDKNPCTSDSCDLSKGCTQVADNGKPCDADGTACTAGDTCQDSNCQQGKPVVCEDGNPCTNDKCDAKTGQCTTQPDDDGVPCDDGTKCTSKDTCTSGVCKGKAVDCDDQNECTDDVCDKQKGCSPQALTGSPCSDDSPCTIGDLCDAGSCKPGSPKTCASPSACILASCDVTQKGTCVFENAEAGTPCDDGSACTDSDGCAAGKCKGALKNCDDNNPCTNDGCDAKLGCTSTANTSPCTDGNACTALDKCAGGKCGGTPIDAKLECDDQNSCTTASCDPKAGCVQTPNLLACDDGNPCTQGDQCGDGKCGAGSNTCACQSDADCTSQDDADLCNGVLFCDKSVPGQFACKTKLSSVILCDKGLDSVCSLQACNPTTGKCAAMPVQDGKACDADASVCTSGDACKAGLCAAGAIASCDDKNPCTTDSCDPKTGCIQQANMASCDADGDACTVGDTCQNKVCMTGVKKLCEDGEVCTANSCNPTTGACVFSGGSEAGKPCDADGSVCTVGDACKSGLCVAGGVKICDDQNPCTDDACDQQKGCVFAPNTQPCDDGNACTANDLCAASLCAGKSLNPQVDCSDGQVCTTDGCDPKVGCTHSANQQQCDDGNPCTNGDTCAGTVCQSGSNVCGCQKDADCAGQEDGDLCNGTLFCDTAKLPYTCKVKASSVVVCDSGKDSTCATNTCDGQSGKCGMANAQDGKACDADASVCTSEDKCLAGLCKAGASVSCDDKNPCTTDSCDPKSGCANTANTASCDADGDACTVGDACQGKVCLSGAKKLCDDKEVCTADSCEKVSGACVFDGNSELGKGCDADGSVCTAKDQCAKGLCVPGAAIMCGDGNPCTDDSCDKSLGCVSIANSATCTDSNACTSGDKCAGGACQAVTVVCNDGNLCTQDTCDQAKGCVVMANEATCTDGNACTTSDTCSAGKCAGQLVACDDKDACTADSCDAVKGCVATPLPEKAECGAGKSCIANVCVACEPGLSAKVDYPLASGGDGKLVVVTDVNGDGKPDMVASNDAAGVLSVFINSGGGSFAAKVDYPAPGNGRYLAAGDLNKDGKPDIALSAFGGGKISVFLNQGNGTFPTHAVYSTTGNLPYELTIADFDGNGANDIATAVEDAKAANVFLNKGDGTFSPAASYPALFDTDGIAAGDLNGDGKPDLALANVIVGAGKVSVLLNKGAGTFASKVDYAVGDQPLALAMGDVNGDGKLDLAVANRGGNNVSVLMGNGDGTLAAKVDYATGKNPQVRIAVVDMNGDAKLDIVTANVLDNTVSVLKNKGNGVFATKVDFPTGAKPFGVAVGDLDADGFGDIITANSGANSLSVLMGGCSDGIPAGMALIPAGKFLMGCVVGDAACGSDEKPQHEVDLPGFYMDVHEVTVAEYKGCVDAAKCTAPSAPSPYSNWGMAGKEHHPVNGVTWFEAENFCEWAGSRLPSEAEWEKASRGGQVDKKYPWGDAVATCTPGQANTAVFHETGKYGCGTDSTWKVGAGSSKNGYGLYDMSGNVWEWVSDWYGGSYYNSSPLSKPQGPNSGSKRVVRGGSFVYASVILRSSTRHSGDAAAGTDTLGFRCARSLP